MHVEAGNRMEQYRQVEGSIKRSKKVIAYMEYLLVSNSFTASVYRYTINQGRS